MITLSPKHYTAQHRLFACKSLQLNAYYVKINLDKTKQYAERNYTAN